MRDTSDNFNVNGNANSMGSQDKQNSVSSDLSSLKTSYGNYHSGSNILGMRTHWRTRKNVGNEEKKQLERENSQHKPQHGWTPDRGLGKLSSHYMDNKVPYTICSSVIFFFLECLARYHRVWDVNSLTYIALGFSSNDQIRLRVIWKFENNLDFDAWDL